MGVLNVLSRSCYLLVPKARRPKQAEGTQTKAGHTIVFHFSTQRVLEYH